MSKAPSQRGAKKPPVSPLPVKLQSEASRFRFKRLFKDVKIPGWVLFIWGTFIVIPDINSRIQFWWDASQYLGGQLAMIGGLLTNPLFGVFLMVIGVAYVIFVDEPKRPATRHIVFPIIGWSSISIMLMCGFVVSIISYTTQQIGQRHIFPMQEAAIRKVLYGYNLNIPLKVGIIYVGTCYDCDGYADEFGDLIQSVPGWSVVGRGTVLGPSRDSISQLGVAIGTANPSSPSEAAIALQGALEKAKIPFGMVRSAARGSQTSTDADIIISARRRMK